MKILIICSLFSCALSTLTGSSPALLEDAPWHVSVQSDGVHICGGTIIDKRWILTSAACAVGHKPEMIQIRYNSESLTEGKLVHVSSITVHDQFNPESYSNNIALINLNSDLIEPFGIASIPCSSQLAIGSLVRLPGWSYIGGSSSLTFSQVALKYLERKCAPYYPSLGISVDFKSFALETLKMVALDFAKKAKVVGQFELDTAVYMELPQQPLVVAQQGIRMSLLRWHFMEPGLRASVG